MSSRRSPIAPTVLKEGKGALKATRGREGCGRPRGGAGGGGAGVPAAEILGKREGQHLRNPPPAAAAAASLRPGELSARQARLPERRQPPAALAPRRGRPERAQRCAGTRTGGGETSPGRGEGHPLVLCPSAPPGPGERLRGLRGAGAGRRGGERWRTGRERTPLPGRSCPLAGCGHPACAGKRCGGLFLEDWEGGAGV